ncbi:MAG: hypothetical protein K2X64_06415 [Rhodocyclaceae bacterium]|nr:hypothetical protein [Rhodocyclaceae bacterium]
MKPAIAAAVGGVVGFGLGVVVAVFGGTWLLSYAGIGPFAKEDYVAKRIRDTESKFGFTCAEVHETAYRFINVEMAKLIEATREGKAWAPDGLGEYLKQIAVIRDQTMKCEMLQVEAKVGDLPFLGNFRGYTLFLMSLGAYVSASDKEAPNDPAVKKTLLDQLQKEYRDLTAISKSTRAETARD